MNLGSVELLYRLGYIFINLSECLFSFVIEIMREVFIFFDKKLNGFVMYDVVLMGVEIRLLLLIRIVRDENILELVSIKNLYLCGEGVGYVGGIVIVVVDGIKCVEKII